jgi:CRP-like cAMP-binding protein
MIDELRFNSSTNQLLGFASSSDRDLLAAQLSPVDLTTFQVLERPQEAIEFIYFPESGIASVIAVAKRSEQIEIGMIGREGMTGIQVALGNDQSPYRTFVQVEGTALRAKTDDLRSAMDQSASLRDLLLRYVQIFLIQTSQTALANATALLPQKIARWLLMSQDRLNTNHIPLTHELLAMMIGVQRSGVTLALGELENHGLITAKRGRITIVDRAALMKMAEGFYGLAEKEYRRRLL